jgi:hypothetical protein
MYSEPLPHCLLIHIYTHIYKNKDLWSLVHHKLAALVGLLCCFLAGRLQRSHIDKGELCLSPHSSLGLDRSNWWYQFRFVIILFHFIFSKFQGDVTLYLWKTVSHVHWNEQIFLRLFRDSLPSSCVDNNMVIYHSKETIDFESTVWWSTWHCVWYSLSSKSSSSTTSRGSPPSLSSLPKILLIFYYVWWYDVLFTCILKVQIRSSGGHGDWAKGVWVEQTGRTKNCPLPTAMPTTSPATN